MEILEFRFISTEDRHDDMFRFKGAWSRLYEYPMVLDLIDKYSDVEKPLIHNTSWGFEGVHVIFKECIENKFSMEAVESSDIRRSEQPNTFYYDITRRQGGLQERYDIVLNVSTVEEVRNFPHIRILDNLYQQVKEGGLLIITFDYPGLNLTAFENEFNRKISDELPRLNGGNSDLPTPRYTRLNCGVLCIRKTKE